MRLTLAMRISSVVDCRRMVEFGEGSRELPVLEPSGDLERRVELRWRALHRPARDTRAARLFQDNSGIVELIRSLRYHKLPMWVLRKSWDMSESSNLCWPVRKQRSQAVVWPASSAHDITLSAVVWWVSLRGCE